MCQLSIYCLSFLLPNPFFSAPFVILGPFPGNILPPPADMISSYINKKNLEEDCKREKLLFRVLVCLRISRSCSSQPACGACGVAFTCSKFQQQPHISFLARFTSAPSEFSSTPLLASDKLCWNPGRCFSPCQPLSLVPQQTSTIPQAIATHSPLRSESLESMLL